MGAMSRQKSNLQRHSGDERYTHKYHFEEEAADRVRGLGCGAAMQIHTIRDKAKHEQTNTHVGHLVPERQTDKTDQQQQQQILDLFRW